MHGHPSISMPLQIAIWLWILTTSLPVVTAVSISVDKGISFETSMLQHLRSINKNEKVGTNHQNNEMPVDLSSTSEKGGNRCLAASATTKPFYCPHCGGIYVSDCLDCDGYLSTDIYRDKCINRNLIYQKDSTTTNNNSNNSNNNYNNENHQDHHNLFMWRDLVGMMVWFVSAGIATACGVGGGGIYVPLGILLLQFAPKSSSGLSQASIFGASLGGLILNIRHQHPYTTRTDFTPSPNSTTQQQQQQQQHHNHPHLEDDNDEEEEQQQQLPSCRSTNDLVLPAPMSSATTSESVDSTTAKRHYHATNATTSTTTQTSPPPTMSACHTLPLPDEDNHGHDNSGLIYTRPLIDYDMALFLAPMEMAGAVLGVMIQKLLPNWLYLTLASIILGFTSYKTYHKWWSTHQMEHDPPIVANTNSTTTAATTITAAAAAAMASSATHNPPLDEIQPFVASFSDSKDLLLHRTRAANQKHHIHHHVLRRQDLESNSAADSATGPLSKSMATVAIETFASSDKVMSNVREDSQTNCDAMMISNAHQEEYHDVDGNDDDIMNRHSRRRQELLELDARQYPQEKLLALILLWMGLVILTFLKGGKGVDSVIGITCESPWYVFLIGVQFTWTFAFSLMFGRKLVQTTQEKRAVRYPFLKQDVLWDHAMVRFYSFFTFCAGVVAGLIGIGGGMVLGPLMLVMDIHPRVSSATTATMIVLTSSSVAVLFVIGGLVPWDYALAFFSVCLVGAYVGKTYIDGYVKRTGKTSLLIFLLATIIALATLGCVVIVVMKLAKSHWCFDGFHKFCNLHSDGPDDDSSLCRVDAILGVWTRQKS